MAASILKKKIPESLKKKSRTRMAASILKKKSRTRMAASILKKIISYQNGC